MSIAQIEQLGRHWDSTKVELGDVWPREVWIRNREETRKYEWGEDEGVVTIEALTNTSLSFRPWEIRHAREIGMEAEMYRAIIRNIIEGTTLDECRRAHLFWRFLNGVFDCVTKEHFVVEDVIFPTLGGVRNFRLLSHEQYPGLMCYVNTGEEQAEYECSIYNEGNRDLPIDMFLEPVNDKKLAFREKLKGTPFELLRGRLCGPGVRIPMLGLIGEDMRFEYVKGVMKVLYPYGRPSVVEKGLVFEDHLWSQVAPQEGEGIMVLTTSGEYRTKKLNTIEVMRDGYPWEINQRKRFIRPRLGKTVGSPDRLWNHPTSQVVNIEVQKSRKIVMVKEGPYKHGIEVTSEEIRMDFRRVEKKKIVAGSKAIILVGTGHYLINDGGKQSDFVGGRLEEGEKPMDAMVREWSEETGLKPINFSYHGTSAGGEYVTHLFSARTSLAVLERSRNKFVEYSPELSVALWVPRILLKWKSVCSHIMKGQEVLIRNYLEALAMNGGTGTLPKVEDWMVCELITRGMINEIPAQETSLFRPGQNFKGNVFILTGEGKNVLRYCRKGSIGLSRECNSLPKIRREVPLPMERYRVVEPEEGEYDDGGNYDSPEGPLVTISKCIAEGQQGDTVSFRSSMSLGEISEQRTLAFEQECGIVQHSLSPINVVKGGRKKKKKRKRKMKNG